jgi:hypothetical protein
MYNIKVEDIKQLNRKTDHSLSVGDRIRVR